MQKKNGCSELRYIIVFVFSELHCIFHFPIVQEMDIN